MDAVQGSRGVWDGQGTGGEVVGVRGLGTLVEVGAAGAVGLEGGAAGGMWGRRTQSQCPSLPRAAEGPPRAALPRVPRAAAARLALQALPLVPRRGPAGRILRAARRAELQPADPVSPDRRGDQDNDSEPRASLWKPARS